MSVAPPLPIAAPSRPCATCGYDLAAHAPGAICPECGARSAEREFVIVESVDFRRIQKTRAFARVFLGSCLGSLIYQTVNHYFRGKAFEADLVILHAIVAATAGGLWWFFTLRIEKQRRGSMDGVFRSLHFTPEGYSICSGRRSRQWKWSSGDTVRFQTQTKVPPLPDSAELIPVTVRAGRGGVGTSIFTEMTSAQLTDAGDQVRAIVALRSDGRPPPKVLLERR